MLDVLGLDQKDKDAIADCYEALGKKYDCEIDNELRDTLANRITELRLLGDYHTVSIKNVFKISDKGREFYILSIYLTEVDIKLDFKVLMFGLMVLKDHYDTILIQPETTWDRLMNFFGSGKANITELKGDKNKYRIAFSGKKPAAHSLPQAFLNQLSGMEKVHIEFYENTFLVTFNKPIAVDDSLGLADFLSRIAPSLS